jgi:hypothetical protein
MNTVSSPPGGAEAAVSATAELVVRGRAPSIIAGVRSLAERREFREPLGVFVLTRALFVLLTYFGVILFESTLHGPHPSFLHQLLPAWDNAVNHGWDTQWYIDIAERGYNWQKVVGTSPTAFFPLYPLLIHIGTTLTHRSAIFVALAVSNAAFLAALVYLWKLARWETNAGVARRAVLYIATFPTALFFFAGYTESLFLFLTVASFYHLRRRDWLLAGVFGGLASATRVTGVLLLAPLVYEYARDRNFSWRQLNLGAIAVLMVPAGLLAFMLYLRLTVGDAMAFTHSQTAWQKVFTVALWSGFLESLRQLALLPKASFLEAHNVINVALGGLFLVWSILAARRLPLAYALYLAAFWLVTLSSPAMAGGYQVPLISLSRYVLALFPVFLYMGVLGERRWFHDAYLVLGTGMLSLFTIQFLTGGWIV